MNNKMKSQRILSVDLWLRLRTVWIFYLNLFNDLKPTMGITLRFDSLQVIHVVTLIFAACNIVNLIVSFKVIIGITKFW